MGFLALWPLAFLIIIPIIILFYILKQRAEQKNISSLYLWKETFKNMEASTPWEKLKHNLLMYLQILLVLCLIIALLNPYLKKGGTEYKNIMLVLDNSGSMNALYDGEMTRLDIAKEKAKDYIRQYSGKAYVTVISGNQTTKLEISNSTDIKLLEEKINQIAQTDFVGDLSATISYVESMVSQWESYEAVFFTDTSVDINAINGTLVSLRSDGANGAIDYVSHSVMQDGTFTVLVKASNYGTEKITSDINLYLNDTIVDIKNVSLDLGESELIYFENLTKKQYETALENGGLIKAEWNEKDILSEDNVSYDKLEATQTRKILLISEQNIFLEKALLTRENIELYKTTNPDNIDDTSFFDLYIFDGMIPEELPNQGNLLFINPDQSLVYDKKEMISVHEKKEAVKVLAKKHIVNESILDFTFGVSEYQSIEKPVWAESFFEAGEDSLGFIGNMNGRTIAILAFDIHNSDLPLQTEFPIFIYQLLGQCIQNNMIENSVLTVGDPIVVYPATNAWKLQVTKPDGKILEIPIENTKINYTEASKSGIYSMEQISDSKSWVETIVLNFPVATESKINEVTKITGSDTIMASELAKKTMLGGRNLQNLFIIVCLILLLLEWIVYIKSYRLPRRTKKWVLYGVRSCIAFLLVLSLLDLEIPLSANKTTTVFLLDVSESISGSIDEGEAFIKEALDQMPKNEQAGVIVFGKDARVEQFVTNQRLFTKIGTNPIVTATNMEAAIQSALALFPEESKKRLVLITDGEENEGSIMNLSSTLVANQVQTKILKVNHDTTKEVYIDKVVVPEKVDLGDPFQVKVQIKSNISTAAILYLYSGTELKATEEVTLQVGENQFIFKDIQTSDGLKSYRVRIEPLEDSKTINNEYVAFTQAKAGEKILLIEGQAGEGNAFEKVLNAANISYDKTIPEGAPRSMIHFNEYKTIILLNVHADDLPEAFLNHLESYVKDYAGGFIVIGGEDSFALGNYRGSSIETVLPVKMDLEGEKQIKEIAIAMVIDHSGSMNAGNGYVTLLDLAKQAAIEAVNNLRPTDYVGVLAFESSFDWVVPLQLAKDLDHITSNINAIPLGGGTSIYPAVSEAYKQLKNLDAKVKHIILLTDGQDGFQNYSDLIDDLTKEGITLSTVAVGTESDTRLLTRLAEQGKGRYYYTDINSDIPRIFAQEVFLSAKSYLIQEEFTPVISSNSELISDVIGNGLPSMYGYIASSKKDLATVHLVSHKEDPILTTWQYGLGKTIAFNSDGEGKWTANYSSWSKYPLFWKNLIKWTITDTSDENSTIETKTVGTTNYITYKTTDYTADTKITGIYTDEEGMVNEIQLEAKSPGIFEGKIDLSDTGVYSINIRQEESGEITKMQNTAFAVQYSAEFRFSEQTNLLETFASTISADFIQEPKDIFSKKLSSINTSTNITWLLLVIALILFVFDVANRRFRFTLGHFNYIITKFVHKDIKEISYRKDKIKKEPLDEKQKENQSIKDIKAEKKELDNNAQVNNSNIRKKDHEKIRQSKKAKKEKEDKIKKQDSGLDTAQLLQKKKDRID